MQMRWNLPLALATALVLAMGCAAFVVITAPVTTVITEGAVTKSGFELREAEGILDVGEHVEIPGQREFVTGLAWGIGLTVLFLWRPGARVRLR
jgi:hypothetical protein